MEIHPVKTPLFKENQDLTAFVLAHVPDMRDGYVLVVTSKIVALSQGRTADLHEKDALVRRGAVRVVETPWAPLVLGEDGWVVHAGVDESNADAGIILLPEHPHACARVLRSALMRAIGLRNLGIIITDTRSVPLRVGTVGRAIGYAGFEPLRSYKGKKDLYGRKSRHTESNVADALATAGVLVMGEGSEGTPLALMRNAPVKFSSKKIVTPLSFPAEKDIFSYVFKKKPGL